MKKKLNLNELRIQSFITSPDELKGGSQIVLTRTGPCDTIACYHVTIFTRCEDIICPQSNPFECPTVFCQ